MSAANDENCRSCKRYRPPTEASLMHLHKLSKSRPKVSSLHFSYIVMRSARDDEMAAASTDYCFMHIDCDFVFAACFGGSNLANRMGRG
jgi:hypothetical protein